MISLLAIILALALGTAVSGIILIKRGAPL